MAIQKSDLHKIKNKHKRQKLFESIKHEQNKARHAMRQERAEKEQENPELLEERRAKNVPTTIESKRVFDETVDAPVQADEFDTYFEGKHPKVLVTTNNGAHKEAYVFAELLLEVLPSSEFVKRKPQFNIHNMAELCTKRDYTDLVVVNEDRKRVNGITFVHLPAGPTFYFSVSNLKLPEQIAHHGRATNHIPELVLNNFSTRLGKTVGRLFQSLFPQKPEFQGRQVVTLHNQRDFIFFRRHRYVFRSTEKVGLQELGPQFTLRLRRLQKGIRDEIAFEHKAGMDKDKRRFYL